MLVVFSTLHVAFLAKCVNSTTVGGFAIVVVKRVFVVFVLRSYTDGSGVDRRLF